MKNLRSIPFHPLLVASFQILSIYATNVNQADISAAVFILLLSVFLTALVFLFFFLITRDLQRSGIIASFYCFSFFIYGRLFDIMPLLQIGGLVKGPNSYLLLIFSVVVIGGTLWVFRSQWFKRSLTGITSFLNIFGLGLVAIAVLMAITNFDWTSHGNKKNKEVTNDNLITDKQVAPKRKIAVMHKPNVYFLIFDSYASPKVLSKYYGWNDHGFVAALRSRGFVVNENAFSNYPFTGLSIASTLNMGYIHEEPGFSDAKSKAYYLNQRMKQNKVMAYFKSEGYDVVTQNVGSERYKTEKEKNSLYSKVVSLFSNELMAAVVHTSVLRVIELELMADSLRNKVLSAMRDLNQSDVPMTPTFLYAHIMCPHLPYIFRADGSKPKLVESAWDRFDYRKGYVEQVRFIGTKIIEIVDIIRNRDPEAVIFVQADHGHGFILGGHILKREKPPIAFLDAQYGILSAIFLPSGIYVPEKSAPVNQFRHLFNALFNAKLEILPDKAFFTPIKEPFIFYEVTSDLNNLRGITE